MKRFVCATIVEGYGDVTALPVLLRRMKPEWHIARPVRVPRQRIVQEEPLRHYSRIADANVTGHGVAGAVIVMMDSDEDCAKELAARIIGIMGTELPTRKVACVLAVREFESWIVAGYADGDNLPDEARGCKGWLKQRRGGYSEVIDQPRLAATMDLSLASRRSRSFRHLETTLNRLDQDGL